MLKKLFFLASLSVCTIINAHAQQATTDTLDDNDAQDTVAAKKINKKNHDLQAIEVRSLRASSNSPFAKTNISAQDLEKQNVGQDLPVLLQFTPSSTTTSDAGNGVGYTGLHIRGTDPSRINVTFNGIPVNDPEEQATFFVDIPDIASSTSSIQIQRGVGTSTNGYIDRASTDLKSLQFTAGWQASERTSFHLLVMSGAEKTGQAWDGVLQDSLSTNRRYNLLGQESNGAYYNNQTDNYLQNYYQLFADHSFSSCLTGHVGVFLTRGIGYYEEYVNGDLLSNYGITKTTDTGATDLIRRLYLDNYYYGSVFSLLYSKNKTKLTFGGGWTQFENRHYGTIVWAQNGGVTPNYKWYEDPSQKNDFNVYLKAEQNVGEKVVLFADMQYRNVAYYINGFQDNPTLMPSVNYNFFNPKAGITYLLRNTGEMKQKLYASMAVANREPNHDDFEANPTELPKPEQLYDAEAGYEINKMKWSFGANLYYMYYHDQLVLTGQINDVGAYTETNVPVSYRAGLELQGAVIVTPWLKLGGNATLSQNKINNYTEYVGNYDNNGNYIGQLAINHGTTDIGYSPNLIGAAMAAITPFHHMRHGQSFELDINEKYVGQQFLDNTGNSGRAINAYSFCNLLLRYSVKTRACKEVTATLALNNIFGQLYENNGFTYPYATNGAVTTQNYYFPQAGFNVMGGLTFRW